MRLLRHKPPHNDILSFLEIRVTPCVIEPSRNDTWSVFASVLREAISFYWVGEAVGTSVGSIQPGGGKSGVRASVGGGARVAVAGGTVVVGGAVGGGFVGSTGGRAVGG